MLPIPSWTSKQLLAKISEFQPKENNVDLFNRSCLYGDAHTYLIVITVYNRFWSHLLAKGAGTNKETAEGQLIPIRIKKNPPSGEFLIVYPSLGQFNWSCVRRPIPECRHILMKTKTILYLTYYHHCRLYFVAIGRLSGILLLILAYLLIK